jgi:hypothetical protein
MGLLYFVIGLIVDALLLIILRCSSRCLEWRWRSVSSSRCR